MIREHAWWWEGGSTVGVQWCVVLSPCMQLKAWGCFEGLHQITATRTCTRIHVQGQISVTVVLVIASQPASQPSCVCGKGWGQSAVQVYLVGMIFGTSRYNSLLFHAVGQVSRSASCHPFFVCMPDTKSFGSWFEHSVLNVRTPVSNWTDLIAPVYLHCDVTTYFPPILHSLGTTVHATVTLYWVTWLSDAWEFECLVHGEEGKFMHAHPLYDGHICVYAHSMILVIMH